MTDRTDLTCRLLAASACTYAIEKPGGVEKCPQFPFVGFKDAPATFQAGPDDINACLVGDMGDGVVLAFRGTIPFDIHDIESLIDWINDFDADPVEVDGLTGRVHDGFHESVASLWDEFLPAVQERMSESKPLYVTGHSKGAGMAPIAAALLRERHGMTPASSSCSRHRVRAPRISRAISTGHSPTRCGMNTRTIWFPIYRPIPA